jgi:hypothetical protein
VDSDATATAHNILAHELLYRSAIVGDVIAYVVSILYTLLLYNLFSSLLKNTVQLQLYLDCGSVSV